MRNRGPEKLAEERRITPQEAGRRYDARTARSWEEDGKWCMAMGAVAYAVTRGTRRLVSESRLARGERSRPDKTSDVPPWVPRGLDHLAAMIAARPDVLDRMPVAPNARSWMTPAGVDLLRRMLTDEFPACLGNDAAELIKERADSVPKTLSPQARRAESHLQAFFAGVRLAAALHDQRAPTASEVNLLAIATRVEPLGERDTVDSSRRRWDHRIRSWAKADPWESILHPNSAPPHGGEYPR